MFYRLINVSENCVFVVILNTIFDKVYFNYDAIIDVSMLPSTTDYISRRRPVLEGLKLEWATNNDIQ